MIKFRSACQTFFQPNCNAPLANRNTLITVPEHASRPLAPLLPITRIETLSKKTDKTGSPSEPRQYPGDRPVAPTADLGISMRFWGGHAGPPLLYA